MKKMVLFSLLSLSSLFASSIIVKDAYVRATPPNMPNSAAFMELVNETNSDISLVLASSTASKVTELHTHDMKDGVMKMYQVPKIDIKANSSTTLQPGGFHIMLIGLVKKPLKQNDEVKLTLKFSNNQEQTITVPVKTVMGGMMKQNSMHKTNHKSMKH